MPKKKVQKKAPQKATKKKESSSKDDMTETPNTELKTVFDYALLRAREISKKYETPTQK